MAEKHSKVSPFVMFWMGLLTGAVIVALVFLYKMYTPAVQTSVLRTTTIRPTTATTQLGTQLSTQMLSPVVTKAIIDPGSW